MLDHSVESVIGNQDWQIEHNIGELRTYDDLIKAAYSHQAEIAKAFKETALEEWLCQRYGHKACFAFYKQQGDLWWREGFPGRSLFWYRRALSFQSSWEVANNLGAVLLYLGDLEGAEKVLRPLIQTEDHVEVSLNIILLLSVGERWDELLETLDQHGRIYGTSGLWYYYGIAYEHLGRKEESLSAYAHGISEEPDTRTIRRFVEALTDWNDEGHKAPWKYLDKVNNTAQLYLTARKCLSSGQLETYKEILEHLTEIDDDPTYYNMELCRQCLDEGQIISALGHLNRLSSRDYKAFDGGFYETQIAWEAGAQEEYRGLMDSLTQGWKREIRQMTGSR